MITVTSGFIIGGNYNFDLTTKKAPQTRRHFRVILMIIRMGPLSLRVGNNLFNGNKGDDYSHDKDDDSQNYIAFNVLWRIIA